MVFAKLHRHHRTELVADFQQYYGLDLYGVPVLRAADLAASLPVESRCMKLLDPLGGWTLGDEILSRIEYWLQVIVWRESKDAADGRNKPEQITPKKQEKRKEDFALPCDEYAEILSRPRKEAKGIGYGTRERVHNVNTVHEGHAEGHRVGAVKG